MPRLILSRPAPVPAPYVSPWPGLSVVWTGWDGSVWDLTDRDSGVALYLGGVEGLHFPKLTRYTSKSRAIAGNRMRGWRAEERDVFWPVLVWSDGAAGWIDRNTAFFRSMHPDRAGTWTVKALGREARSLDLTLVVDDSYTYDMDPLRVGWAEYPVSLEAARPYWRGEPVKLGPWKAPNPQPFFGAGGYGPPFYISGSESFGHAVVNNPGDIEAWGVWTVTGGLTGVELGVGGAVITVPFSVPEGSVLQIDTDPRRPTAKLDGVNVTPLLGLQDFAPVPDGAEVPLHVQGIGTGSVEFEITPLYFRAF